MGYKPFMEKYRATFEAEYPQWGSEPLAVRFRLKPRYVVQIACALGVKLLPRDQRHCYYQGCVEPLRGHPAYTGNYCTTHYYARQREGSPCVCGGEGLVCLVRHQAHEPGHPGGLHHQESVGG
jgi:hypothetical protein